MLIKSSNNPKRSKTLIGLVGIIIIVAAVIAIIDFYSKQGPESIGACIDAFSVTSSLKSRRNRRGSLQQKLEKAELFSLHMQLVT
jgi:uncharacterized membrane protein